MSGNRRTQEDIEQVLDQVIQEHHEQQETVEDRRKKRNRYRRIRYQAAKIRTTMTNPTNPTNTAELRKAFQEKKKADDEMLSLLSNRMAYEEEENKAAEEKLEEKRTEDMVQRTEAMAELKRQRSQNTVTLQDEIEKKQKKNDEFFEALLKVAEKEVSSENQVPRAESCATPVKPKPKPRKSDATTGTTPGAFSPIHEGVVKSFFRNTDATPTTTTRVQSVFLYHHKGNSTKPVFERLQGGMDGVVDAILVKDTPILLNEDGSVDVYTLPPHGSWFRASKTQITRLELPGPATNIHAGDDTLIVQVEHTSYHVYQYKCTGVLEYLVDSTCEMPCAIDLAVGKAMVVVIHKEAMQDKRGGFEMRTEKYALDNVLSGGGKRSAVDSAGAGGALVGPWGPCLHTSTLASRNRVDAQAFVYGDDDKAFIFAEDIGGNCKNFKVPAANGGEIDGRARWNFNNTDLATATSTTMFPVVCHKSEGLFYESSKGQWYPITLEAKSGKSSDDDSDDGAIEPYQLVGGEGVILAAKGSTVSFIRHVQTDEQTGKVRLLCRTIDFASGGSDTGITTSIVAMDSAGTSCVVVVEDEFSGNVEAGSKTKHVKGATPRVGKASVVQD